MKKLLSSLSLLVLLSACEDAEQAAAREHAITACLVRLAASGMSVDRSDAKASRSGNGYRVTWYNSVTTPALSMVQKKGTASCVVGANDEIKIEGPF